MFVSSTGDLCDLGYYMLNKTFIADNFCVNKSNKDLKCQGKCYLMSNIKENKSANEDFPQAPVDIEIKWQLIQDNSDFTLDVLSGELDRIVFVKKDYSNPTHSNVFHPPQFLF